MKKRCLLLALLLGIVACKPVTPEENATLESFTPGSQAEELPQTFPPLETNTPRPVFTIGPTSTFIPLPTGSPRLVGGAQVGLQIAMPSDWVNRSDSEFDLELMLAFLTADSPQTINRAFAGQDIMGGAFVLGWIDPAGLPVEDPIVALNNLVGEQALVLPATVNQIPAAYADLNEEPFAIFPPAGQPRHYRLLLLVQPETQLPVYVLFGSNQAYWAEQSRAFDSMMRTVVVYKTAPDEIAIQPDVLGEIMAGTQTEGILSVGQTDIWHFNGQSNQYATITIAPNESDLDMVLTLLAPSGEIVAEVDYAFAGETETLADFLLIESGTYSLYVREFFRKPGRYTLHFNLTDTPLFSSGGRINLGQVIMGNLTSNTEQIWTFTGMAGQSIGIILTPVDGFDAILEFRDPNNRILISLDEGFSGDPEVISGFPLEISGDYQVEIRGFGNSSGSYTLSVVEGDELTNNFYDAGDLAYGQRQEELLQSNEAHAWFFNGLAGDKVHIVVNPMASDLDMDIWLLNPAIQRLAEEDSLLAGESETIAYTLPADGQYIVLVLDYYGQPGPYAIELAFAGNEFLVPAGPISYAQPITNTLLAGRGTAWQLIVETGQKISIDLAPASNSGDLLFMLRDPAGNIVLTVNEKIAGESERLDHFTLSQSGIWTIIIRDFHQTATPYHLTLSN